jgi:hypothetical protein
MLQAIQVKEVIDHIDEYTRSVGYSVSDIKDCQVRRSAEVEDSHDYSNDDELPAPKKPKNTRKMLIRDIYDLNRILKKYERQHEELVLSTATINVLGVETNLRISDEQLKQWFDSPHAVMSASGRHKELPHDCFQVHPSFVTALSATWMDHLYPTSVRVLRPSLHLYAPTPEIESMTQAAPSMVVCLANSSVYKGGVYGKQATVTLNGQDIHMQPGTTLMMLSGVEFHVKPLQKGHLALLCFQVVPTETSSTAEMETVAALVDTFSRCNRKPFGLCLKYHYAHQDAVWSPSDRLLVDAMKSMPNMSFHTFPFVSRFAMLNEDRYTSEVYPLTDVVLNAEVPSQGNTQPTEAEVRFFNLCTTDSYTWDKPEEEESDRHTVCLGYAVLLRPHT